MRNHFSLNQPMQFFPTILLALLVKSLSYKLTVDIEHSKSQLLTTYHPNILDSPVPLSISPITIKVKIQDKESLEVIGANQVILSLANGDDHYSFLLSRVGAHYSHKLVYN